jgi:hypothetical protein
MAGQWGKTGSEFWPGNYGVYLIIWRGGCAMSIDTYIKRGRNMLVTCGTKGSPITD